MRRTLLIWYYWTDLSLWLCYLLFVYFFFRLVPTWRGWWWIWCCRWDPRSRPSWEELLIILLLCCAVNNYWLHAIVEDQKCHVKRSKPTIGNKKLNVGFARKVQPTRQPKLEEGVVVVFRQIQRTKVSILLWSIFSRHFTHGTRTCIKRKKCSMVIFWFSCTKMYIELDSRRSKSGH